MGDLIAVAYFDKQTAELFQTSPDAEAGLREVLESGQQAAAPVA